MSTLQTLQTAVGHHQAGQLHEAQLLYRQVLQQDPNNADALHLLGVLAFQSGQSITATKLIQRAIAIRPLAAEYHCNLGNALRGAGRLDEAIAAYRRAIELQPDLAEAYNNLSLALEDIGQLDEAITACHKALELRPDYAEAHNNLGKVLVAKGDLSAALACYRQALALQPNFAEVHNNLGTTLAALGQTDEAIACYNQAIALKENYPQAHFNLGHALREKKQPDAAIAAYRKAITLQPDYPEAYNNLGSVLKDLSRLAEAITAYQQAITLRPIYAEAHSNLGLALSENGRVDDAIACYRKAIALRPDYAPAHSNLGIALNRLARLDEAATCFRKAIALDPADQKSHSHLLLALNYLESTPQSLFAESTRWAQRHAEPLRSFIRPHHNDRAPNRRLRVGYVSADFREHPCALFMAALFKHHDPKQVEVIGYAEVGKSDDTTTILRQHMHTWHNTVGQSDTQVAELVRKDQIDILIDLKLHTDLNRLLVFARKPAPIQITWLGYPGTTGLSTIDYRLTDPYLDPPGLTDAYYAEQSIRLPDCFWCYDPMTHEPAVNALPALSSGTITFGSLNSFSKINAGTLAAWAKVLHAVPGSQLVILCDLPNQRTWTLQMMRQAGIEPQRIAFLQSGKRHEYLSMFHRIDVGLDPMPCPGHTTTFDSLWMGVPVITLPGQTAITRAGLSILSNIGLQELVAHNHEEYIRIAASLANDLPRLAALRLDLRQRLQQSPLMNAKRFAQNMEAAYRQMWRKWCAENSIHQ